MAHDVFISYSTKDKAIADAMCVILESKGIGCWIAPRDILPGMDWGESIIDAITTSRVVVLLLSSNSNASLQVKREVERAVSKEVIIIPFRIEDVRLSKSLEYHLSATHWLDALTPPIEEHLQALAVKVRQLIPFNGNPHTTRNTPNTPESVASSSKVNSPLIWRILSIDSSLSKEIKLKKLLKRVIWIGIAWILIPVIKIIDLLFYATMENKNFPDVTRWYIIELTNNPTSVLTTFFSAALWIGIIIPLLWASFKNWSSLKKS